MSANDSDTIAAIATAKGRGSVGIVRISGSKTQEIAAKILGVVPRVRLAEYLDFKSTNNDILDVGLALYFKTPHSFTGEDVLELQGHGGAVVLDSLLQEVITLGARLAEPGEFSKRAFLNNKIDLLQAEAIADLIAADSKQAALAATRSLQGEFSKAINKLINTVTTLRVQIEAAIDFPDEDIGPKGIAAIKTQINILHNNIQQIIINATQGAMLSEGFKIVIMGEPNAGKSSILNCLAKDDIAIVTNIPGTTRDIIKQAINIAGVKVELIDTAGIRSSDDAIEQEGIKRAWAALEIADHILLVVDSTTHQNIMPTEIFPELKNLTHNPGITILYNKIDLLDQVPDNLPENVVPISAKKQLGFDLLLQHMQQVLHINNNVQGNFIARTRHVQALERSYEHLLQASNLLANEFVLVAEELRLAQNCLGEITGRVSSDMLLGKIFSEFCIGK